MKLESQSLSGYVLRQTANKKKAKFLTEVDTNGILEYKGVDQLNKATMFISRESASHVAKNIRHHAPKAKVEIVEVVRSYKIEFETKLK